MILSSRDTVVLGRPDRFHVLIPHLKLHINKTAILTAMKYEIDWILSAMQQSGTPRSNTFLDEDITR